MAREDGRARNDQARDHHFGLDVLQQDDGSARLVAGKTEILASVVGPMAVKARQERTECAAIQVIVETLSNPPSVFETEMSVRLKGILEKVILTQLHPRSLISITVQPIAIDGPCFAHMLNACIAALIDAAVPLRTTFMAVSGVVSSDGIILLDSTNSESSTASAKFDLVFDAQSSMSSKPIFAEYIGVVSSDTKTEIDEAAFAVAKELSQGLRKAAKERLDLFMK